MSATERQRRWRAKSRVSKLSTPGQVREIKVLARYDLEREKWRKKLEDYAEKFRQQEAECRKLEAEVDRLAREESARIRELEAELARERDRREAAEAAASPTVKPRHLKGPKS